MAAKQTPKKVDSKKTTTENKEVKPQLIQDGNSVVKKEPAKSFDERTRVQQPWLNEDGDQVNQ